jgi:hypothetical protein
MRRKANARTVGRLYASAERSLESLCLSLERKEIDHRRWQTRVFKMASHVHAAAAALALGVADPGVGGMLPDQGARRRQFNREYRIAQVVDKMAWMLEHVGIPAPGWQFTLANEILNLRETYLEELHLCHHQHN